MLMGAAIAQLVERLTEKAGMTLTRVGDPSVARDFSPRVSSSADSYGVRTAPACERMHQHLGTR